MKKYFNLSRYKELLKLEEDGKISFLDLELLRFQASVGWQLCYNRKKDYLILIDEYLSRIITPYEFRSKFLQMEKEDSEKATLILEDFQELEVFTLANDLEKFSDLIGKISDLCFEYDELWDGTIERMSESEFYYWVLVYRFWLTIILFNSEILTSLNRLYGSNYFKSFYVIFGRVLLIKKIVLCQIYSVLLLDLGALNKTVFLENNFSLIKCRILICMKNSENN